MLELNIAESGEIQILSIVGRLDSSSSSKFENVALDLINSGKTKLVFDLSALEYISSAGLRVLLVVVKRVKPADGALVLCGVNAMINEVFDICGFTDLFKIVADQDGAVATFY